MNVVLPAPLAPSKPKVWFGGIFRVESVQGGVAPEAPRKRAGFDADSRARRCGALAIAALRWLVLLDFCHSDLNSLIAGCDRARTLRPVRVIERRPCEWRWLLRPL